MLKVIVLKVGGDDCIENCGINAKCTSSEGVDLVCTCDTGFYRNDSSQNNCVDIDECVSEVHKCPRNGAQQIIKILHLVIKKNQESKIG